jgi:N-methylhydantoinase B/oxoprolinase/acetone carboxylase alpha subunit
LSERRAFSPYGLLGGEPAQRGLNLLTFKADSRTINLGGKNTIPVDHGDRLTIYTPGGGGYGSVNEKEESTERSAANDTELNKPTFLKTGGSLHQYTMNQETV